MAKDFSKFTIIRDTREQNGLEFDSDDYCTGVIDKKLDTGDYSLLGMESRFVLERKATPAEIAHNVLEDRFIRELERLSSFESAHIIIQAELVDILRYPFGSNSGVPVSKQSRIKMRGKFILKKLIEFQQKFKIHIWFAGMNAEDLAMSLFKQAWFNRGK